MKAKFKIGKETKIKDKDLVRDVINQMRDEDNLESVISTLGAINHIFTFGDKIPGDEIGRLQRIPREIRFHKIIGRMTIEVTCMDFKYNVCTSMLVKGKIDGKEAIAEVYNYAEWKDGWLVFEEEDESTRQLHAQAIYFLDK